jgi:hypothetical protein
MSSRSSEFRSEGQSESAVISARLDEQELIPAGSFPEELLVADRNLLQVFAFGIAWAVHGVHGDPGVDARFLRICDLSIEALNRTDSTSTK